MSLRIGAVSYLNTKPLIHGFRDQLPDSQLFLDLPSRLADRLAEGDLDVALIPSVEFLRSENLSIVSDACIACRSTVRSVRLLFNKPPAEVRTLALDEGSRTSAALAQVLLAKRFNIRPALTQLAIDDDYSQQAADAVLIIGDRAMHVEQSQYFETWDLGEQWNLQTGLSFVFAMWVTHHNSLPLQLSDAFHACRESGLQSLDSICANEAAKHGLTHEDCKRYFTEQLHFQLGPAELSGLNLFRQEAARIGLVPESSIQLSLEPI